MKSAVRIWSSIYLEKCEIKKEKTPEKVELDTYVCMIYLRMYDSTKMNVERLFCRKKKLIYEFIYQFLSDLYGYPWTSGVDRTRLYL